MYRKGKQRSVFEYIRQNIEDSTRFVCEMMGHNPETIWKMNVYEFFRDLLRAKRKQEAQLKQIEDARRKRKL